MGTRPFRFGLNVGACQSREDFLATVRRADATGYSVIVAPDHFGSRLAVLPMLVAAAEISPTLRVSPMVMANDYRHPASLAKETATIDVLSGGRFELGLGTGWIEEQYAQAGIGYDSPRVRVNRLEEAIAVIKGLWGGGPFSFGGDHYRLTELASPRPVQRPHPPLLIAGGGPRMLRLAGAQANIVSINPLTPGGTSFANAPTEVARSGSRVEAQLSWINQGAGPRFGDIELSVMVHRVIVTADADAAIDRVAEKTVTPPEQIRLSPNVLIGSADEIVELLLERRDRLGISYPIFAANDLDGLQPVVEKLHGE